MNCSARWRSQCSIARFARCDVSWVAAVFVGSGGTEKRRSAISSCRSAARTSRCSIARFARAMFAGLPASSSDLVERKSVVPPSPPADRRREHRGRGSRLVAADFVLTRGRKRVPSLLCTLLAALAEAGACQLLPSSFARRRKACLLTHSSRTAARQPGSARRRSVRCLLS